MFLYLLISFFELCYSSLFFTILFNKWFHDKDQTHATALHTWWECHARAWAMWTVTFAANASFTPVKISQFFIHQGVTIEIKFKISIFNSAFFCATTLVRSHFLDSLLLILHDNALKCFVEFGINRFTKKFLLLSHFRLKVASFANVTFSLAFKPFRPEMKKHQKQQRDCNCDVRHFLYLVGQIRWSHSV